MSHLDYAFIMSEHKGACNALIAACRLLNLSGKHDAAELMMRNIEQLVPQVPMLPPEQIIQPEPVETPDVLPLLPDSWPFPTTAGEGEL